MQVHPHLTLAPLFVIAFLACDRSPRAEPEPAPAPQVATAESVVASVPVDSGDPTVDGSPAEPEPPPPREVPPQQPASAAPRPPAIAGTWGTCHEQFRPTSSPERDVLRLALLCGPANGMKQLGSILQGTATDAGAEHSFDAKAGECFRLFAVADADVRDLEVELRDPAGARLAGDAGGRWPVVGPDGPVCLPDAGRYTVRVRARDGRGGYALTIWRLPAAK